MKRRVSWAKFNTAREFDHRSPARVLDTLPVHLLGFNDEAAGPAPPSHQNPMEALVAAAACVESARAMEREVVAARQAVAVVAARQAVAVAAVVARAARARVAGAAAAATAHLAEAPSPAGAAVVRALGDEIATCLAHCFVEETDHSRDMRMV